MATIEKKQLEEPSLDREVLMKLSEHEGESDTPSLVGELLEIFFATAPQRIGKLQVAVRQGDAQTMNLMAHTLKTSCGYLGAVRMKRLCLSLEEMGKTTVSPEAASVFEELADEYAKVSILLEKTASELTSRQRR